MASPENSHPEKKRRRWKPVAVFVIAAAMAAVFGGRVLITDQIETRIKAKLQERGMDITWSSLSWTPWRGIHLGDMVIRQSGGDRKPVAELENLAVRFPLFQFPGGGKRPVLWTIDEARLDLHDETGKITLEQVSLTAEAIPGKILVTRAIAREDGLIAELSVEIDTRTASSKKPFQPNFSIVRGILATLDIRRDTGPFRVAGDFDVDARGEKISWNARLKGGGRNLEWKNIPLREATAEARLSSADSTITVALATSNGSAKGTLVKTGWGAPPFEFKGTLTDSAGRADSFHGSYGKKLLTIERLDGPTNLLEIAADIPAIRKNLPGELEVREFPEIAMKNLRADFSSSPPRWEIESLATDRPASLVARVNGQELAISDLTGSAAYDGEAWRLKGIKGKALGGAFSLSGNYRDGKLSDSRVEVESIKLSDVKRLATAGAKNAARGIIFGTYRGDLDLKNKELDGSGKARLENAPVFEVPLLDPVYDLFASLIPGIDRAEEGRFDVDFTSKSHLVQVTRFEAKGGSLTVSAKGTVNLKTRTVEGSARGKLTGLPGTLTSPLGRLLEMDVAGPFDNIRVKPLGPAKLVSNAASGTVGTAFDVIEEAGNITGDFLKKGVDAPLRRFRRDEPDKK